MKYRDASRVPRGQRTQDQQYGRRGCPSPWSEPFHVVVSFQSYFTFFIPNLNVRDGLRLRPCSLLTLSFEFLFGPQTLESSGDSRSNQDKHRGLFSPGSKAQQPMPPSVLNGYEPTYSPRAMPDRNVSQSGSSTRLSTGHGYHPMRTLDGFRNLDAHDEQSKLKRA